MDLLILIKNGCDSLTATAAPSLDSLGLHMVISLATIMLVWFGVQEALASAQGGPGFNIAKFISFFVLITFAYCFVKFYDGAIQGSATRLKASLAAGQAAWLTTLATIPLKRSKTQSGLLWHRQATFHPPLLNHTSSSVVSPSRSS